MRAADKLGIAFSCPWHFESYACADRYMYMYVSWLYTWRVEDLLVVRVEVNSSNDTTKGLKETTDGLHLQL